MSNLRFIYLFFMTSIVMLGCSKRSDWEYSTIFSGNKEHFISRLCYPYTNYLYDIQLEIISNQEELVAYLNLYSIKAPSIQGDEKTTIISFKSPNGTWQLYCHRLEGGQKLKFTEQSFSTLLQLLHKEPYLVLGISDSYRLKIDTKDFLNEFKKLNKSPLIFMPNKPLDVAF